MDVRRVYMVLCALQLQRGGIVGGCKAPVWIKWSSVSRLMSGGGAVALRRNCIDSYICGMRGVDTSLCMETMMEVEWNARRAILRYKFESNSSFWRFILEQEPEKIQPYFNLERTIDL